MVGPNGAGKTSLLEAAYLVATTRSFRTPRLHECLARTSLPPSDQLEVAKSFAIAAEVEGIRRVRLEIELVEGLLVRQLDGGSVPMLEYLEPLPVVVWSARESEVLKGEPERSRLMMDRGLVNQKLSRLAVISKFRHCLRQKRELLRRRQGGLEEWNTLFAQAAAELIELRSAYAEMLAEELEICRRQTGVPYPPLGLVYEPSPGDGLEGAEAIERQLTKVVDEERRLGRPVIGPHRDRLRVMWGQSDVSQVASAGERKAVGLLLLRAQVAVVQRTGRSPLVLVDDIDAEIDVATLNSIWGVFSALDQLLVSSSRAAVWRDLEVASRWSVESGHIEPLRET